MEKNNEIQRKSKETQRKTMENQWKSTEKQQKTNKKQCKNNETAKSLIYDENLPQSYTYIFLFFLNTTFSPT